MWQLMTKLEFLITWNFTVAETGYCSSSWAFGHHWPSSGVVMSGLQDVRTLPHPGGAAVGYPDGLTSLPLMKGCRLTWLRPKATSMHIQWNLSWETTAMRDHLSWKTTHFWQKDQHFNTTEPVTGDHRSWETTFCGQLGVFSQDRFYCTWLFKFY